MTQNFSMRVALCTENGRLVLAALVASEHTPYFSHCIEPPMVLSAVLAIQTVFVACEGYEDCLAGIKNLLLAFSFLILSLKET